MRDLTDPGAGPHAIQLLVGLAAEALSAAWTCPARPCPGPRVVAIADNYDNLGFTVRVPRGARRPLHALRRCATHAAQPLGAMVPPHSRALAASPLDDVAAGLPGHLLPPRLPSTGCTPERRTSSTCGASRAAGRSRNADMHDMIALLVGTLAARPKLAERTERPPLHSRQAARSTCETTTNWVEVWRVRPRPPRRPESGGPAGWHGLALGLGLDRLLMLRKHIPDIRLLRSADPRSATS